MVTSKTPRLDLHGEEVAVVKTLVETFINDNYKMGNKTVAIIHGKSTNILTREVHNILKDIKIVNKFYLNNWNVGETIAEINIS